MAKSISIEEEIVVLTYKLMRSVNKTISVTDTTEDTLSMLQLRALSLLSENNVPMSDIAKSLGVKLPTATSLVDRLFIAGLIERVDDPNDRRKVLISLTSKGKKTYADSIKAKITKAKYLLSCLSSEDRKTIVDILRKVYKKLGLENE